MWIFALIAVAGAGLIASVLMLAVGLIRRRRRVWGGAIGLGLLCLFLLVGGSAWATVKAFHAAKRMIDRKLADADAMNQGSPQRMREWYEQITGVKLPPEAVYINGRCVDELNFSNYFLKFTVPPAYQAVFKANFQPAAWADVQANLTPWSPWRDWRSQLPFWDISRMQGKIYHQKVMTDNAGKATFSVSICYDPAIDVVCFVAMEAH